MILMGMYEVHFPSSAYHYRLRHPTRQVFHPQGDGNSTLILMNRNPLLLWGSSEGDGRSTQAAGRRESKAFSSSAWHVFPVHRMAIFIFFSSHRHQGVFSGCSFFQLLICPAVSVSRHGPARLESSAAGRHRSFRKSSFSFQAVPPPYSSGRTAPPSIRPSSKLSGPLERRTPNCLLIPRAPPFSSPSSTSTSNSRSTSNSTNTSTSRNNRNSRNNSSSSNINNPRRHKHHHQRNQHQYYPHHHQLRPHGGPRLPPCHSVWAWPSPLGGPIADLVPGGFRATPSVPPGPPSATPPSPQWTTFVVPVGSPGPGSPTSSAPTS